jgi:hypothetical protein
MRTRGTMLMGRGRRGYRAYGLARGVKLLFRRQQRIGQQAQDHEDQQAQTGIL